MKTLKTEPLPETRRPAEAQGPVLSIIFVHYRTPEMLRQALQALRQHPPSVPHEIIVVDNGPREDGAEEICREHPLCRYDHPGKNLGYARGVNRGIALSRAPFLLILNPDILVTPGSVDRLLDVLRQDPQVGIAGPKLVNPDGSLQHSCRTFYTMRTLLLRRTFLGKLWPRHPALREHLMLDWDHATRREVDWLIGASLMVRREMVDDVGGMDERFFLYFEDVDWCYRAHQHGWKVLYCPEAVMIHHYQRASAKGFLSQGMRWHLESVLRYYEKWSLLLYVLKLKAPQLRLFVLVALDLAMLSLAFLVAYNLRAALGGILTKPVFELGDYLRFLFFSDLVSLLIFAFFGLYAPRAWFDPFHGWWQLLRAMATISLVLMASTFLMATRTYSRFMVLLFFPLALLFVGLGREGLRRLVRRVKAGGLQVKRMLVVGPREAVALFQRRFQTQQPRGVEGLFLPVEALERGAGGRRADPGEELVRRARRERIGEVIILEAERYRHLVERAARELLGSGISVELAPREQELLRPGLRVRGFLGFSLVPLSGLRRNRVRSLAKRLLDLLMVAPLLVLGWPWHLFQRLRGGLVAEERIGRRGQPLRMRRYRRLSGPGARVWWLRLYPLLPEVLRGRMSLVGIYPLPRGWWERLPEPLREHPPDAPPGLLGPWGRDPWREPENPEEVLLMNEAYVRRWSMEEDLRILYNALLGGGGKG
jgi:hypothetical protein